jgi:hypothetical protein
MNNQNMDIKNLGNLKKQELIEIAKSHGLTGYSKFKKDELIEWLTDNIAVQETSHLESKLHEYCKAAIFLYGVIYKEDFLNIYNHYEGNTISYLQLDHWIVNGNLNNSGIFYEEGYFINEWLKDMELWKKLLETQQKYTYYVPVKKEEFLAYGKKENQVPGKTYNELRVYLRNDMKLSEYVVNTICNHVYDMIAAGYLVTDILENILELRSGSKYLFNGKREVQALGIYINKIIQNTRMINYCGHTAVEVGLVKENAVIGTLKKFYPNDKCPCGSGKKYKFCCGRI